MTRLRLVALCATLLWSSAACSSTERGGPPSDTLRVTLPLPDSVRRAREESLAVARQDSLRTARDDSLRRTLPGYVVDSVRSPEEDLARFREGLAPAKQLVDAVPSLDSLVASVVARVNAHDRLGLQRLVVTKGEYAWLVFPDLPIANPPYRQPPDVAWMLQSAESGSGLRRLLERFREEPLRARGYECAPPSIHGRLRAWSSCRVTVQWSDGRTTPLRLFGAVIEIGGEIKLLSFANDF